MLRRTLYITLVGIVVLAIAATAYAVPQQFNAALDAVERQLGVSLPEVPANPFKLGLDLQGGVHLLYSTDLSKIDRNERENAVAGLRDVIERRINRFGVKEPVVQTIDTGDGYRLSVEIAGAIDAGEAIDLIGETPFLEFREVTEATTTLPTATTTTPVATTTPTELTGRYLQSAELRFEQTAGKPFIGLQFNQEGSELFADITERNEGERLAIFIDGSLISAPVVQQQITGGQARITGDFTVEEARQLARNLSAGALPVPIELISQQQIGATLGQESLQKSLRAGLLGFLAIIVFMIVFYRLPGVLSSMALLAYVAFALAMFKVLGVTLTLAGIGGFILSIGMAIDANILVLSRFHEEGGRKQHRAFAVAPAFQRAWPAIRDGNITTLAVAFILFVIGTGFVKGFAVTLSIGLLVSMATAMLVTRVLIEIVAWWRVSKIKLLWY